MMLNNNKNDQQSIHHLLEDQQVKEVMSISYQQDFAPLKNFFSSLDQAYMQQLIQTHRITLEPIQITQNILKKIKLGLRGGEESLKQSIRKKLIQMFYVQQPVPAIYLFLNIDQKQFEIKYLEDFQSILETMMQKFNNETFNYDFQRYYDNFVNQSDEELILHNTKLLNKKFEMTCQMNQKQFDVFTKVYEKLNKIDVITTKEIICQIIKYFKEFYEKLKSKRVMPQDALKTEKFPQFVLKIVLLLLVEQKTVIPELLLFLYLKTTEDKKTLIAIKAQVKEIQKMFMIEEIKPCLNILRIDETIFQRGAIGYDQVYNKCQKDFPVFLTLQLNGALISYVEFLQQMCHTQIERFLHIYDNYEFQDLLTQIWAICGSEIQQITQNIVIESIQYAKYGSNILRIGTNLFKIKFRLEKRRNNLIEKGYDEDYSQERRTYGVTERNMNPLFKNFITKLVHKNKPYPLLLKTLKMDLYNLKVGYRINEMRELVSDQKFKKYMKETHGVVWSKEDPDANLDDIIQRQYPQPVSKNGKKYELNWPKLIKKQAKLIYENREQLKQQLFEVYDHGNFMKVYNELIKLNDENKKKMKTKEVLIKLVDYIEEEKQGMV